MSEIEHISVKIVVIGEPAVGKTTLRHAYSGKELGKTYAMTLGADIIDSKIELKDENVVMDIQIFDLAGQETFDPLTRQFLRGTQGAIMVFDLTRDYTFDKVNMWLEKLHEENPTMDNNIPFIIVGNKADLDTFISVDDAAIDDFLEYANRHKLFSKTKVQYIKTSAKTGYQVKDAFYHLSKTIFKNFQLLDGDITQEEADEALSIVQDVSDARKHDDARLAEEKRLDEQRRAEEARLAEERRLKESRRAEEARLVELQRADEARLAGEKKLEEEARLAEEARLTNEKKLEEERIAKEVRLTEVKRLEKERIAEENRLAEEQRKTIVSDLGIPKAMSVPPTPESATPPMVDDHEEEAEIAEIRRLVELQKAKKANQIEEKKLEEERKTEKIRLAEQARLENEKRLEEVRKAEEIRLAEQARLDNEKRLEEVRKAEEEKLAEEARIVEEKRLEEERKAEEAILADEARIVKEKELEIKRSQESKSLKLYFVDREFVFNPKSSINSEAEIEICTTHRKVTLTFGETAGLITKRITSIQAENISRSGYLLENGERIGLGFELVVKEES